MGIKPPVFVTAGFKDLSTQKKRFGVGLLSWVLPRKIGQLPPIGVNNSPLRGKSSLNVEDSYFWVEGSGRMELEGIYGEALGMEDGEIGDGGFFRGMDGYI